MRRILRRLRGRGARDNAKYTRRRTSSAGRRRRRLPSSISTRLRPLLQPCTAASSASRCCSLAPADIWRSASAREHAQVSSRAGAEGVVRRAHLEPGLQSCLTQSQLPPCTARSRHLEVQKVGYGSTRQQLRARALCRRDVPGVSRASSFRGASGEADLAELETPRCDHQQFSFGLQSRGGGS